MNIYTSSQTNLKQVKPDIIDSVLFPTTTNAESGKTSVDIDDRLRYISFGKMHEICTNEERRVLKKVPLDPTV